MSYFLCDEYENMEPYIPGEQPKDKKYIKLNANESPMPPSPKFLEAISESLVNGLGYYCDPHCMELREAIAEVYDVTSDEVFVGNGADEVLSFALLSFFNNRMKISTPDITYDFYRTYAKTYGIDLKHFPLNEDFTVKIDDYVNTDRDVILANPNNPTGLCISVEDIEKIVTAKVNRMVIIDEAYIDYGNESCIALTKKYNNLIVVQTFSKSRNLAGARIGFAIANKGLIEDMNKIKFTFNPFNLSEFAIKGGSASVKDKEYLKKSIETVIENRNWTKVKLEEIGFEILEPSANFLMITHKNIKASKLTKELKNKGVLVRHYAGGRVDNFVRITIGTFDEMKVCVEKIKEILG